MIINTKNLVAVGDVVAVKLVSGEELVGALVAVENEEYTIDRPVVLHLVPTGNGQGAVSFAPFMLGVDVDTAKVTIHYSKMLTRPLVARDDAAAQYRKATTGIETVPAGAIITK